ALGEADVIDVRVRQEERAHIRQRTAHRLELARQILPVARRARVDDRDLATLLEEVRVHQTHTDAMDPRRDPQRARVLFAAAFAALARTGRFAEVRARFGSAVAATVS